jgi:hypothetical protein
LLPKRLRQDHLRTDKLKVIGERTVVGA